MADEQRSRWLDMVHAACFTLSQHSPSLVSATTISARIEGLSATQRHELLQLARDVAGRQRLGAEIEDDGSHLVARFSRPAAACLNTPDATEVPAQAPREEGAGTTEHAGSLLNPLARLLHRR